jgi:hypothetical protein
MARVEVKELDDEDSYQLLAGAFLITASGKEFVLASCDMEDDDRSEWDALLALGQELATELGIPFVKSIDYDE